jgi:chemotaxis protein histidine kinase CheA
MATVNKDFKIKSGLIVEGLQGTINNKRILTEDAGDQYILDLIGGETLVKSVSNEFDVSAGGELSLDRVVVDAYYDAAGDAAAAQAAAEATASADATSKANAAQAAAEATASADATSKANAAQAAAEATASADATSKANAAQAAAEATASADATSKANAAQAAAEATASADATSKANAAEAAANLYTDGAVSALVDSAPELLNTLNELAEALGDSPDTITNLTTLVGTKADTSYVDSEISDLDTAAQGYASAAQAAAEATASADATSKANAAQAAAEATASADATSKANAAEAAAIAHADALTTSDVAEGTAQYFTDARAKSSAASLLTGATLTNITITGTGAGLTITAENGVADSTTSDLAEGSRLYFTDERAVDALEAVVPNFTAVEVNSVAKQVASTMSAASAGAHVGHAFAKADYRSAEFLVKVAYGSHTEISKVLLTLDASDNIAMTEYGIVGTNGTAMSVSANVDGANVQLLVTTTNNNSTVTVVGTLLA